MKNRNINIDIIKGIGIILMVGGHCGMPFTRFIYLFHISHIVRAGSLVDCVYVCGDYCSSALKRDVEKIERKTGEKIFSGEINGQKVAKRNRSSFNC